jgi:hypothetical protein
VLLCDAVQADTLREMLEQIMDDEDELRELNLSSRPRREERRKQRERDRMERQLTRCVWRYIIGNSCCSQAMVSAAAYDSRIYMLVLLLTGWSGTSHGGSGAASSSCY